VQERKACGLALFRNPDRRIVSQMREKASASSAGRTQAAQNPRPIRRDRSKEFV